MCNFLNSNNFRGSEKVHFRANFIFLNGVYVQLLQLQNILNNTSLNQERMTMNVMMNGSTYCRAESYEEEPDVEKTKRNKVDAE